MSGRRSTSRAAFRARAAGLCALGLLVGGLDARGQPAGLGVVSNFTVPDYYEPPHQTQLRWLLKGAEAVPQAGGRIVVRRLSLERFQPTGGRDMLIEAAECVYDSVNRQASSASPLTMQLQDGQFTLAGEGFFWQPTNSLLVISNRVRTTIRGGGLTSQPAAPALGDAQVSADQFTYDGRTTQAAYRGQVRVTGTNLALACGQLSFALPTTGAGTVDTLVAEQDVAIDFGELHASGEHAVYTPGNGSMHLTGKAAWQAQGREGRGEDLLLDSSTLSLRVRGGAMLQLPVSGAGFIPRPEEPAAPSAVTTNRFVTVTAERYELQTNQVSFSGSVQAIERADNTVRSRLACGSLLATFGPSNQVQTLVAEQDVIMEQGERRLTGAHAAYDGTTGAVRFTGQPEWRDGERSGQGEVLLARLPQNQLAVRGRASLSLPHTETGGLFGDLTGGATNRLERLAKTNAAVAPPTRISSDEYTFAPEEAVFRGQVRVDDAQMQLTTDALALKLAPGGTNLVSITADQNVVMSLVETNGQATRATCARAVYAATKGVLELTGQPRVQRPDGSWFSAEVIAYHPATGDLRARGRIHSKVMAPAGSATNALVLPFNAKPGKRKK